MPNANDAVSFTRPPLTQTGNPLLEGSTRAPPPKEMDGSRQKAYGVSWDPKSLRFQPRRAATLAKVSVLEWKLRILASI